MDLKLILCLVALFGLLALQIISDICLLVLSSQEDEVAKDLKKAEKRKGSLGLYQSLPCIRSGARRIVRENPAYYVVSGLFQVFILGIFLYQFSIFGLLMFPTFLIVEYFAVRFLSGIGYVVYETYN
jgi:hypothetical protein